MPLAVASINSSHDAYVTGSPALYSVLVQPSVVFLATLQLDVMSVAGAVYSDTYNEGSCMAAPSSHAVLKEAYSNFESLQGKPWSALASCPRP